MLKLTLIVALLATIGCSALPYYNGNFYMQVVETKATTITRANCEETNGKSTK